MNVSTVSLSSFARLTIGLVALLGFFAVVEAAEAAPFPLTVTKQGSGTGQVTSQPSGIDCGADCTQSYEQGTTITLTATASQGSRFTSWGGSCAGILTTCQVTMSQARNVTANFSRIYRLTVLRSGSGKDGSYVTTVPFGTSCGTDCADFVSGTEVQLTPLVQNTGYQFDGWVGCDSLTGPKCVVAMNSNKQVTAYFTRMHRITVVKPGNGEGKVVSTPTRLDCGDTCYGDFEQDSQVTLTATPEAGSTFVGWSGGCQGSSPTCLIPIGEAKQVVAEFTKPYHNLTVSTSGTGSGSILSTPSGIDCGVDCQEQFTEGSNVTLTAMSSPGSNFQEWTGACIGADLTCVVNMGSAKNVTAVFAQGPSIQHTLDVTRQGTGSGAVTSAPSGINCGDDCQEQFTQGSEVTLIAKPDGSSQFAGWSGACSGSDTTCQVKMDEARTVTARFDTPAGLFFFLNVSRSGNGAGTITSTPDGINCGVDCENSYPAGSKITLTAAAAEGSAFLGWSGGCQSSTATCDVTMDRTKDAVANFTSVPTTTAIYTGKFLFVRLKCPKNFKPKCRGQAEALTAKPKRAKKARKKVKVKAMTRPAAAAQRAGRTKVTRFFVKPAYRAKIRALAKTPNKKLLVIRQTIGAKKYRQGKRQFVYQKYKVLTKVTTK